MAHRDRARNGPLRVGLLVLAAAFTAVYVRSAPPAPLPADAPAESFSAGRALVVLEHLVGDGTPHPIGTDANARVRARLADAFAALGYATEIQTTFACSGVDRACATVNNVIAQPRALTGGPVVLLVSHYDSVAAGPGASDAGVSVAAILEVARALASGGSRRNPVAFLVTDGEEAGLIGASGFVAAHPLARHVGAVVNLEARGTSGPSVMFETSGGNAWLVERLGASLERPLASSLFYPVYERLPNDTDLTVFKQAGIPGVNFAFIGDVARYHSPLDDVAHANAATVQHHGDNALAIAGALAEADFDERTPGNAVFFDVLGFGIVHWPTPWTLPLASAAFVLVALATLLGWRSAESSPGRTLLGLVAWLLAAGLPALGAWRLVEWMTAHGAWPGGATTQPHVSVLTFWLAGFGTSVLVLALFARRAGAMGAWSGVWLGWSAAALGVAIYFPEAAYVLVVPALAAGMVGLVVVGLRASSPGAFAGALPSTAAAVLLMPPAWMLFDALGPTALPVSAAVIAVVATTLAPAIAAAARLRWLLPVSVLGLAAGLGWLSLHTPAFSTELPERVNVTFFQQAGVARARWIVSTQSGTLPDSMRAAAEFGTDRAPVFPWSRTETAYAAEVDRAPLEEPRIDVLDRRPQGSSTVVRLRAVSPRRASTISLLLPPDRILGASMNGVEIPLRPADADVRRSQQDGRRGLGRYTCVTVPAGGVEIELVLSGSAPLEGYILDLSSGLVAGSDRIIQARPAEARPNRQGDVTILARQIVF